MTTVDRTFRWTRRAPFDHAGRARETWDLDHGGQTRSLEVEVRYGKDIDVTRVKQNWPYERELAAGREILDFFRRENRFEELGRCPVCGAPTKGAASLLVACGVDYARCPACSHVYARSFPHPEALEKYYRLAEGQNPYYVDPAEIELRLEQIYEPKIDWIVETYARLHGRKPESVLDIGAGAGHFLYGCHRRGLAVAGIEPSAEHGDFCRSQFGIPLCLSAADIGDRRFDVVTSFNVIEHAFSPADFVADHKRFMHRESLAVIETPKVNSVNVALQGVFCGDPRGVVMPYLHNHLFTDASLATLLVQNGLDVRAAWYFGQDVPELIRRLGHELGADSSALVSRLAPAVQRQLDACRCSDVMIFASTLAEADREGRRHE